MGSDLSRSLAAPRLNSEKTVNPQNRLFANYPEPDDTPFRVAMRSIKHSKCEPLYFGYYGVQGAIVAVILGVGFINPLVRHSPYLQRKFVVSMKPSEKLVPINSITSHFMAYVPRYATLGFTAGVLLRFFNDLYDHTMSTNLVVKNMLLGTGSGAFFGFWFGGFRYHWHGAGLGLLMGLALVGGVPSGIRKMRGEVPPSAAEYLNHTWRDKESTLQRWVPAHCPHPFSAAELLT